MGNLVSMTDFIQLQKMSFRTDQKFRELVIRYANFLQQPLELWMFVPCGKDGQPLKIIPFKEHQQGSNYEFMQHELYRQAKERCLFEGYEYISKWYNGHLIAKDKITGLGQIDTSEFYTIEDLIQFNIKLTPAALIQFT